jgi:amino acid transporter
MGHTQKKFGAFSGVFTPSILTILGVIMYMRLGWVVGQAGLYVALGIILIAHVISVTTALSISSIATDKKIKSGGIYYMLSRSLGLPMGGAIGMTLFSGTALSIALYIVGFSESFLAIDAIRDFLHLEANINAIRIVGTAVIVFLVIIAFISTSLAIKTQYFILIAIALSLVSIIVGMFLNGNAGSEIHYTPIQEHESFALIFAIFFPAVTGFTAGVAMSGDLKNPKKDIPKGVIMSVVIGLIVYISLAIGLAYFIDADSLVNDSNILLKIAWFAPLLIAGIWGATLSSALGGILGGPRILQAMSLDRVTPKIFGKGHGINKEPRNALILTFLIAEAGILIGELDVIARIVSMFYIAAYAFINLSYSLESWASSDFRPSFRIPKAIGLIGFIACFFVMFQIDMLAMIMAFVIILLVYLLLKRKELQLDLGDVWQSVWSTVIRNSLHKIDKKEIEERNWKPNILLFSTHGRERNNLVAFGKYLIEKHGFLSNFDLIENKDASVLFPKNKQAIQTEDTENFKGLFVRQQSCRDYYEGVDMIARTYGFSGVEPNTVLFGWSKQTEDPIRFVKTLQNIDDLDMNILLMDYDKERGFGKKESIDIWWRGKGNNGNLSLSLTKLLLISNEWRNAHIRLLIENPINAEKDSIVLHAQKILDNLRIDAEIRVINNQIEKKSIYDLVKIESISTDLIFVGIPEIAEGKEKDFIQQTNTLCEEVGSMIFVKASGFFKELKLGRKKDKAAISEVEEENKSYQLPFSYSSKIEIPDIIYPDNLVLKRHLRNFSEKYLLIIQDEHKQSFSRIYAEYKRLITELKKINDQHYQNIINSIESGLCTVESLNQLFSQFINKSFRLQKQFRDKSLPMLAKIMQDENKKLISRIDNLCNSLPEYVYYREHLKGGKTKTRKTIFSGIISKFFPLLSEENLCDISEKQRLISMQFIVEMQKFVKTSRINHLKTLQETTNKKIDREKIDSFYAEIEHQINQLNALHKNAKEEIFNFTHSSSIKSLQTISSIFHDNTSIKKNNKKAKRELANLLSTTNCSVTDISKYWKQHQHLAANIILLQLHLLRMHFRIKKSIKEISKFCLDEVLNPIENYYKKNIDSLRKLENLSLENTDLSENPETVIERINYLHKIPDEFAFKVRPFIQKMPESLFLMDNEFFNNYNEVGFKDAKSIKISVSRLLDYLLQNEITDNLQEIIGKYAIEIGEMHEKFQDKMRYFGFLMEAGNEEKAKLSEEIAKELVELNDYEAKIRKLNSRFLLQLEERVTATEELLSVSKFIKTALNIKEYVKEQESKKRRFTIKQSIKTIQSNFKKIADQYWYRQSKATILAAKMRKQLNQKETQINDFIHIYNQVKAREEILEKLPYYYKQLFINKNHFVFDLWQGRQKELVEAESTINEMRVAKNGALLILGNYNSGKSFFSQYIAQKFCKSNNVFMINPPYEGSVSEDVFIESLQRSFENEGSIEKLFGELPADAVIIFDELELWWEKHPKGFVLIDRIIDIIYKYSQEYLFIVNANTYSFNLINRIQKIQRYFLNSIECGPINAENLEKIILRRHNSSGLKLKLRKNHHPNSLPLSTPRFFAAMFNYSKGNIGVSLQSWLANIYDFDGKSISVTVPKTINTEAFDKLEDEWYLLLLQFILHKRMTIEKLQKIQLENKEEIFQKIMVLKRARLIEESKTNVYNINPYMYPHIIQKLVEKEMI